MPSSIEEGARGAPQGPPARKREAGAPGGTRKDGRGRPKAPRVSRGRELAAVALGAVALAAGLGGLLGSGPGPASPPAAAGGPGRGLGRAGRPLIPAASSPGGGPGAGARSAAAGRGREKGGGEDAPRSAPSGSAREFDRRGGLRTAAGGLAEGAKR